jgi:hypothetical protein
MTSEYDQAARYAGKHLDAEGFLRWLVPHAMAVRVFRRFLDTRTLTFPGEPDRTCDTVAELDDQQGEAPPVALVIDFKARPESGSIPQLDEYGLRLYREVPAHRDPLVRYDVVGGLVNLTGPEQGAVWELSPKGFENAGKRVAVVVCTVAICSAPHTLEDIAGGRTARCILAWVPLMAGGGQPETAVRWQELASQEPDVRKRVDYAGLALVFAELAGCRPVWQQALEGWNVERSQIIGEWRQQGQVMTLRKNIERALQIRFPTESLATVAERLAAETDLATLDQWFDLALRTPTLQEFQRQIIPPSSEHRPASSNVPTC